MHFKQQIVVLRTQCTPIAYLHHSYCLYAHPTNTIAMCGASLRLTTPPNVRLFDCQAILVLLDLNPCLLGYKVSGMPGNLVYAKGSGFTCCIFCF